MRAAILSLPFFCPARATDNLCLAWAAYAPMRMKRGDGIPTLPQRPFVFRERMSVPMSERVSEKAEPGADRADRNLAAWSALAGLLLFAALAGPFFAGRIYTADDLGAFYFPILRLLRPPTRHGPALRLDSAIVFRLLLTGEGQTGSYHPLHQILYRCLPLRAALGWEYLLPYPLMMLGMWLCLKRRLGRSDAAMFGALVFTFSSFNLLHFVHPNVVAVVAHVPWLLWAIDIVMVDSRRRRVALATTLIALLTGSQLLIGHPQSVWYSLLAECTYVIMLRRSLRYDARVGSSARRLPGLRRLHRAMWPRTWSSPKGSAVSSAPCNCFPVSMLGL